MAKERRLGRGIEALLNQVSQATETADRIEVPQKADFEEWNTPVKKNSNSSSSPSAPANASTSPAAAPADDQQTDTIHYLDINLVDANPYQPRTDFDAEAINELAQSLNIHGLLQPTVVRPKSDGRYELISGERRLRAAIAVGWQQIPAMIIEVDDTDMAILALVENVQRKDLNAIEKAKSFKRLMKTEGCTQEELAKSLGLDRSTVANLVRLLDLPQDLQTAIREDVISAAHGRALLPLKDAELQREFMERIVSDHLSAHQVEDMVRDFLNSEDDPESNPEDVVPMKQESAQLKELENAFYSTMGMKVKLSQGTGGKGKMTISFKNHDQFERLQSILMSGDYSDVIGKKRKAA